MKKPKNRYLNISAKLNKKRETFPILKTVSNK